MDSEFTHLTLDNLMIAAPCDVGWEDMTGDGKVRNCSSCKLNVYNVMNMTSKEVETLLESNRSTGDRLCMQLYRRADGTLLTADCPQGLKKVRAFTGRFWRTLAAAIALLVTGSTALADDKDKLPPVPVDSNGKPIQPLGGKICPPDKPRKNSEAGTDKTQGQTKTETEAATKPASGAGEEAHHGKAHFSAFNMYNEGQQYEKAGAYVKAVEAYQKALTLATKQKHDIKFHLKIETALSRAKAKAGMKQ